MFSELLSLLICDLAAGRLQGFVAWHEAVPFFLGQVATDDFTSSLNPSIWMDGDLQHLAR